MRKIKILLNGGLGNQLFQVLHGLNERELSNNVFINTSLLRSSFFQKFILRRTVREINVNKFEYPLSCDTNSFLYDVFVCFFIFPILRIIGRFGFDGFSFFGVRYKYGYWHDIKQSEINNISKIKFDESKISEEVLMVKKEYSLLSDDVAFIHIRRGDYVKLSHIYNNLSMDYYISSLVSLGVSKCIIFTDDHEFVKNNINDNLNIDFIFSDSRNTAIDDMYLMSSFKKGVIANSTFSWWAASINDDGSKIIIGPKNWFVDKSIVQPPYRNNWIKR